MKDLIGLKTFIIMGQNHIMLLEVFVACYDFNPAFES